MAPRWRVLVAAAALGLAPLVPAAELPAVTDPTLRAAIRLVEDGDLERGVLALDTAMRRLAGERGADRSADRTAGHLYLGMAYLGLGQLARARGHLREAWTRRGGEPLDSKVFPPRVVSLYAENGPPAAPNKNGGKAERAAKTARKEPAPPVPVLPFVAGVVAGGATAALLDSDAPAAGAGPLSVRIFNCDDHCRVWLNGRLLAEVGLAQDSGRIDLGGRLAGAGSNVIAFDVANAQGGISYGFEVRAGEAIVFQRLCGVAARLGCEDDRTFPPGVARRYEYVLAPR